MELLYKIDKEASSFRRTSLTGLGHISVKIETIHAFKDIKAGDRFLRIGLNSKLDNEELAKIDQRLSRLASLDPVEQDVDKVEEIFKQALSGTKRSEFIYKLYFDRATYV